MSRIGKKPIEIPSGVDVKIENDSIVVKGPKGMLSRKIRPEIGVELKDKEIRVYPKLETKETNAFWGLTRQLIFNMVKGVVSGFEKQLEIQGIGYRASLEGKDLVLEVGFSHPVKVAAIDGISFSVNKNVITVSGIDKELVGNVAAKIRKIKPAEPYKGKGIRYLGEEIIRKAGKKASVSAT